MMLSATAVLLWCNFVNAIKAALVIVRSWAHAVLDPLGFDHRQHDVESAVWTINTVRCVVCVPLARRVVIAAVPPVSPDLCFFVDWRAILATGR